MSVDELVRELASRLCPEWGKVSIVVKTRDDELAASLVVRSTGGLTASASAVSPGPR